MGTGWKKRPDYVKEAFTVVKESKNYIAQRCMEIMAVVVSI